MFSLLSPIKIVSIISGIYATIWMVIAYFFPIENPWSALRYAAYIEFFLLIWAIWGWQKAWARFPILNKWVFPDFNGKWDAKIQWVNPLKEEKGQAEATVYIVQNFFKISIELNSKNSESETQIVVPKRDPESGRPLLHYVYIVKPNQVEPDSDPTYEGAALLKLNLSNINLLEGNYFTSRHTKGHFSFKKSENQQT